MDINEIKKLIREDGSKIIVTDEKGPAIVILDYQEYKALKDKKPLKSSETITSEVHKQEPIKEAMPRELEDEPLKIEDLPF